MSSEAIATIVKMMEALPDSTQDQVVEHLRAYLLDMQDEARWDSLFEKKPHKLIEAARKAKREIAEGKAKPMDYDDL